MNDTNDDGLLVAYADGELDADAARAFEARLADDPALRERLDAIREGGAALAPAFQALLAHAPADAMQASLARGLAAPRRSPPLAAGGGLWGRGWRIAAAAALVVIGVGLGRLAPPWLSSTPQLAPETGDRDDWRAAVAEYVELYTPDTFADAPRGAAAELARLGAKIGVDLSVARISVADLQFRGAQILSYDGTPLGQIAYLDPAGLPVLFCIFANAQPDSVSAPVTRGELSSVSWERGGKGFMVIARTSPGRVAEMADTLKARF